MKPRSPVLGYNHNVRYAGRLWHVQTEDSGVQNPHIFTHLFHDGTILATKRLDYDAASEVAAVQKLMQAQHKGMLRDLKAGAFDEKIAKFFGEPVQRVAEDETTDPNAQPPIAADLLDGPVPKELPNLPSVPMQADVPVRPRHPTPVPPRPSAPPVRPSAPPGLGAPRAPMVSVGGPPPGTSVGGIGGRRPSSVQASVHKPAEGGVVVARPAVIIGGEPQANRPGARPGASSAGSSARWNPPAAASPPPKPGPTASSTVTPKPVTNDSIFGADLISEKSLDEVILAYLSEDLNDK